MATAAQTGYLNAWAAATYLLQRGVPFRIAHEQVGKAVRLCLEKGCELQDLPLEQLQQVSPAFDVDVYKHLTLDSVLALHDVYGGTAPHRVQQAIREARRKLESTREGIHAHA
jgi:argininosuccinate lyase